ncbi:MAG: DUF1295 domain-containing protein [archaeon]|nr:DUF1295 domain-containing protein [archaeon]
MNFEFMLWAAFILFIYMILGYIISIILKDFGIVDVMYGIGHIVTIFSVLILKGTLYVNEIIVSILISLWGIRLAFHIYSRNKLKGEEDFRYRYMRKNWEPHANRTAFYKIFLLQGCIIFIIDLSPIFSILGSLDSQFNWYTLIGFIIWLIGYYFQVIGDLQLKKFIKNRSSENKDKICDQGLWQYTRHPNYFGECVMWWGIFFITIALNPILGWFTIVSPLLVTFLLLKVSGVPPIERHYRKNKQYDEYKKRTSKFIPFPPKREN